jgi:hypothetical protein
MSENNRFEKYKPDNAATETRDICPADGLTLNDVPAIQARGQYREEIDSFLTSMLLNKTEKRSGRSLAERNASTYQIESLPEADALVEACDLVLHANAEADADTNLATPSKKSVSRVKREAKEIARGLRAAVDELETTENHPDSRRQERARSRGSRASTGRTPTQEFSEWLADRTEKSHSRNDARTDGGRRDHGSQITEGQVKGRRDFRLDSFETAGHSCDNPKCDGLADVVTPEGYLCETCAEALREGNL